MHDFHGTFSDLLHAANLRHGTFTITLRHASLSRTHLDDWSARRRDLYLTTHNTHKRYIHTTGGIRTHDPSMRADAEVRLRPRGHRDRHLHYLDLDSFIPYDILPHGILRKIVTCDCPNARPFIWSYRHISWLIPLSGWNSNPWSVCTRS
jgi:hypothetical protein